MYTVFFKFYIENSKLVFAVICIVTPLLYISNKYFVIFYNHANCKVIVLQVDTMILIN